MTERTIEQVKTELDEATAFYADCAGYFDFWRAIVGVYPYLQAATEGYRKWWLQAGYALDTLKDLRREFSTFDEDTKPIKAVQS